MSISQKPQRKDEQKKEIGARLTLARKEARERGVVFGTKKGTVQKGTLNKELSERKMKQMIMSKTPDLIRAGFSVAMGTIFVYKIDSVLKRAVLLTDPDQIAFAIEQITFQGGGTAREYFYATTKEPDHKAIEMLLNRAYGKPKESIAVDGEVKFSLVELSRRADELEKQRAIEGEVVENKGMLIPPAEK